MQKAHNVISAINIKYYIFNDLPDLQLSVSFRRHEVILQNTQIDIMNTLIIARHKKSST